MRRIVFDEQDGAWQCHARVCLLRARCGSIWPLNGRTWLSCVLQVIYGVFFTVLAATSYRVIILGAESVPAYGLKRRSHREFGFFGWILAVYLVYLMV